MRTSTARLTLLTLPFAHPIIASTPAGIGNIFFQWLSTRTGIKARTLVQINCLCISLVPVYGLLGAL